MESDTLNPTHTERHTQKGYTLGFFILSLSRDGKEEPEQQQKRERLNSVFPHDDECYWYFADTTL